MIAEDPKSGGFGLMLHLEIRTHWWSRVPKYPGGTVVNIQVPSTRGMRFFLLEKPLDTLRPRGHNYALPVCHSMLHKKSFIVTCLYRFVGVGPLSSRPVIPKGRYHQGPLSPKGNDQPNVCCVVPPKVRVRYKVRVRVYY